MSNENQKSDSDLQVEQMDPAQQQLAGALRSSFRLLSVIMLGVLLLFAVKEVTSIGPNQVGVIYRFGKIQDDVVEEGLAYAWPFMIGRVEVIDVSQQEIEINDFWVFETAADRLKPLQERRVPDEGLRPGYDGALLTGDNSLYHVRLRCGYKKVRSGGAEASADGTHPAILYQRNVADAPEMIRSVLCKAAIRIAGGMTASGLNGNRGYFADEVRTMAQTQLDEMETGMEIVTVSVTDGSWPLQTLGDFAAADAAQRKNSAVRDNAKAQARRILQLVAGQAYTQLVGDPVDNKPQDPKETEPYDLIGQYAKARTTEDGGDNKESEKLLTQINEVLSKTKGSARKLVDDAQTESTEFVEGAKRRTKRFTELLPQYRENPEFMMTAEWTKVLSAIFASPTVELIVVGSGKQKINIQTKQNPDTVARIVREMAKLKAQESTAGGGD
jgi:modulator of FtsH protease HflK